MHPCSIAFVVLPKGAFESGEVIPTVIVTVLCRAVCVCVCGGGVGVS